MSQQEIKFSFSFDEKCLEFFTTDIFIITLLGFVCRNKTDSAKRNLIFDREDEVLVMK